MLRISICRHTVIRDTQRQPSTVGHGIARVNRQVQECGFEQNPIGKHLPGALFDIGFNVD